MRRPLHAVLALIAVVGAGWASTAAQAPSDIDALIALVGERVADYHRRVQSVMCVERSTVQPIQSNLSPDGFARTVDSELRLTLEADGDAGLLLPRLIREIRRINGREPRARDLKDRTGCTDPSLLSPEPLAFLLPAHRGEYRFTSLRQGRESDRAAVIIEFVSTIPADRLELIEDERGHDDCFDWVGPVRAKGRVWVDAATHDVLRVERRIGGPVDIRVPWPLQRRHNLPASVVLEREDQTMRYRPLAFHDPEEVMLLPVSMETLTLVRAGLQSTRRTETFSSYRRFVTAGRIVKNE